MSSLTGTPVAAALPLLPTVIWNWIVLPGLAALVPANEPDGRVRTSFSGLRFGIVTTTLSLGALHGEVAVSLLASPLYTAIQR